MSEVKTVFDIKNISVSAYFCNSKILFQDSSYDCHHHDSCEIYINISGKVAFRVEDKVYGIKSGDVIITKPYEKHHCIINGPEPHNHFCMHFSADEGDEVLRLFFDRKQGESNLISLPSHKKDELLGFCRTLTNNGDIIKKHIAFYSVIDILSGEQFSDSFKRLPADVQTSVNKINDSFASPLTVKELAVLSHVTENTLTRHFNASFGMSPYAYIQNMRFTHALSVLESGGTVTEAALSSGFADYSHFIALFKKRYGKTPLQMKKDIK